MESFPDEALLPPTLTEFAIQWFSNLKWLNFKGFQHLTSLQRLEIWCCYGLRYLIEERLPASLSSLILRQCPLLKQRCQRDKGKDWPKISLIPFIQIEDEVITWATSYELTSTSMQRWVLVLHWYHLLIAQFWVKIIAWNHQKLLFKEIGFHGTFDLVSMNINECGKFLKLICIVCKKLEYLFIKPIKKKCLDCIWAKFTFSKNISWTSTTKFTLGKEIHFLVLTILFLFAKKKREASNNGVVT